MSYIGKGVETVTFNTATTLDVAGNITLGGTVDGRDVATDGTKLDTITSGAIANILQDTTPQLGGNLDLNTSNIIGTGNINVTGSITGTSFVSTGNMSFTNNSKAIFGTSPSLEIYHDGSNSILDDVGAGNFKMQLAGADKLEITSTGVDVTGTVTADGLTVDTSDQVIINHSGDGGGIRIDSTNNTNTGSLRFGDAADNYIGAVEYNHSTDALSFYANNATRMTISSAGNVGIGTAPNNLLEVRGTSSGQQVLHLSNAAGASQGGAQNDIRVTAGGNTYWGDLNINAYNMKFSPQGSEAMRITSSGNVGIGITTPDSEPRLHVRKGDAGGVDSATNSVLTIENNTTAILQFLTPNTANQQIRFGDPQDTGAGFIQYNHSANAIQFGTNGPEKMRIDVNGRLLIGATVHSISGSQKFEVQGGIAAFQFNDNSSSPVIIKNNNSVAGNGVPHIVLQDSSGNRGGIYRNSSNEIGLHGQGALTFHTGGTAPTTERMRIDSSGNLRIGTTAAQITAERVSIAGGLGIQKTDGYPLGLIRGNTYGQIATFFNYNGSLVGSISVAASSTSYNTSSDYRLKTAVNYDWDATTRLKQLRPARFEWIADGDNAVPVDGFLAHEVQDIVPEAISGTKDAVDEEGNPEYQGIDQSKLVPLLVKTIQELEARIAALENT